MKPVPMYFIGPLKPEYEAALRLDGRAYAVGVMTHRNEDTDFDRFYLLDPGRLRRSNDGQFTGWFILQELDVMVPNASEGIIMGPVLTIAHTCDVWAYVSRVSAWNQAKR